MVLYHCCMSKRHAEALVRDGFEADAFVAVTESPPYLNKNNPAESHAVVMLGAPFDFNFADYRVQTNLHGATEYLVPASVLNQFQRAVWPR